jgi:hypothetical protein
MDIISIITGILSWIQVGLGQAPISATTIYHGAVLVDKVTTEDFRGTWTAELQELGIQTIKGLVVKIDKSDLY